MRPPSDPFLATPSTSGRRPVAGTPNRPTGRETRLSLWSSSMASRPSCGSTVPRPRSGPECRSQIGSSRADSTRAVPVSQQTNNTYYHRRMVTDTASLQLEQANHRLREVSKGPEGDGISKTINSSAKPLQQISAALYIIPGTGQHADRELAGPMC